MGSRRIALPVFFALVGAAACGTGYTSMSDDAGADAGSIVDASTDDGTVVSQNTKDGAAPAPDAAIVVDATTDASGDAGNIVDGSFDCDANFTIDPNNCGTCGHICDQGGCSSSECEHIVFVAIPPGAPNLGGITGADAICQSAAVSAGLHGKYLAWIATTAASPSTRFFKGARAYVLPEGTLVALNYTELTGGSLRHGINAFPDGGGTNVNKAWTSVADDGTYLLNSGNCSGWTTTSTLVRGGTGNVGGTGNGWTASASDFCNVPGNAIYCVEQ